jgi:hypothetical protein
VGRRPYTGPLTGLTFASRVDGLTGHTAGTLSEVAVWERQLTAREASTLARGSAVQYGDFRSTGLLAFFAMEESRGRELFNTFTADKRPLAFLLGGFTWVARVPPTRGDPLIQVQKQRPTSGFN